MVTQIQTKGGQQKPSGKMYLSVDQLNLQDATWTLVELDTVADNFSDGIEDTTNHKITPGVPGFYDVKGSVGFKNTIADKRYLMAVRVNGTDYKVVNRIFWGLTTIADAKGSAHLYLSATDYLELLAFSDAGVNTVDLRGLVNTTFLSVQRVR